MIPAHRFDYIDIDEYASNLIVAKISYSGIFILTLKSVLVYMADIGMYTCPCLCLTNLSMPAEGRSVAAHTTLRKLTT